MNYSDNDDNQDGSEEGISHSGHDEKGWSN